MSWKESLRHNFEETVKRYVRNRCHNECEQQCAKEEEKKTVEYNKKGIESAYSYCQEVAIKNKAVQDECDNLKAEFMKKLL